MKNSLRQTVVFNARPREVYDALMVEKKHAAFTGAPTKLSGKVGGAFSCYSGYVKGFNLELVPGKLIVQAWRGRDWPKGAYSVVTYSFAALSGGRTKLSFAHVGIPPKDVKSKIEGWKSFYWAPLKKYLEE
jgi:activator of HSP90 ATPase